MKHLFFALVASISLPSFASWNEVECQGFHRTKQIVINIERSFPRDTYLKNVEVIISEAGAEKTYHYQVGTIINPTIQFREYYGGGLRLQIDHRPDRTPRTFWSYPGNMQINVLNNQYISGLQCRFNI